MPYYPPGPVLATVATNSATTEDQTFALDAGTQLIIETSGGVDIITVDNDDNTTVISRGLVVGMNPGNGTDPSPFNSGPWGALIIGSLEGEPAPAFGNGGLYAIARANPAQKPYTGLAGYAYDNSYKGLYFGGGNWDTVDASYLAFYCDPDDANEDINGGELVFDSYAGITAFYWPVQVAELGVGSATPVGTQAHIADPAGGGTQDTQARTAINSILNALEVFGLLATS